MTFKGELYPFQSEAVDMMLERGSLLLAHDMGLGKTVSSIAAVEELIDTGEATCVLVICAASVKWQWKRKIDEFTDGALVKVVEGTKMARRLQYRAVKRGEVEYVLMNCEQVVNDWDILRLLSFDAIVIDEITSMKSPGAKRTRYMRRLDAGYKFGLTGQPIENRPEELFSIMQFIDPTVLGRPDIFDRTFIVRNNWGKYKFSKNLPLLRKRMGTAMHRKTRDEVKDQLPAIVEEDYLIDFDPVGAKLYHRIVTELLVELRGTARFSNFDLLDHYAGAADNMSAMGQIMPKMMALRMLCDHPGLLSISAKWYSNPKTKAGSEYAAELKERGLLNVKSTPKMAATLEVISEIMEANPDNKVVLFSFFKPMLRLLSKELKVGFEMFTGAMDARQRDAALQRFHSDKDCRVLLSSDAGGIGVDIPAANFLLSYDLPFSAGKFAQRQARIDRISSKWESVTLLNMLMRDSIEEWMLDDVLIPKARIAKAWIDGKGVDTKGQLHMDLNSLGDFLEDHEV